MDVRYLTLSSNYFATPAALEEVYALLSAVLVDGVINELRAAGCGAYIGKNYFG